MPNHPMKRWGNRRREMPFAAQTENKEVPLDTIWVRYPLTFNILSKSLENDGIWKLLDARMI